MHAWKEKPRCETSHNGAYDMNRVRVMSPREPLMLVLRRLTCQFLVRRLWQGQWGGVDGYAGEEKKTTDKQKLQESLAAAVSLVSLLLSSLELSGAKSYER